MKIYKVVACRKYTCPNYLNDGTMLAFCNDKKVYFSPSSEGKVPNWCPLDDYKED